MIKFKDMKAITDFLLYDAGHNTVYWVDGTLQARRYVVGIDKQGPYIHDTKLNTKHPLTEAYLPKLKILD